MKDQSNQIRHNYLRPLLLKALIIKDHIKEISYKVRPLLSKAVIIKDHCNKIQLQIMTIIIKSNFNQKTL